MKGRHAVESARRRESEARSALNDALKEISQLKNHNTALSRKMVESQQQATEILRLRNQLDEGTSDALNSLQARYDSLFMEYRALADFAARIAHHWERVSDRLIRANGGGIEGIEELVRLLSDVPISPVISMDVATVGEARKLNTSQVKAIQRARGLRK